MIFSSLYPTTGINVVHVGIQDDFKHHAGVIKTLTFYLVQFLESFKIETVNYCTNNTDRSIFHNIFINSLRKKYQLVGSVRMKMYLSKYA